MYSNAARKAIIFIKRIYCMYDKNNDGKMLDVHLPNPAIQFHDVTIIVKLLYNYNNFIVPQKYNTDKLTKFENNSALLLPFVYRSKK